MWDFNNSNCVVEFKEKTRKARSFINFCIVGVLLLSFLHLLYYGFLWVDDSLFVYSGVALSHIVTLLNMDYTDYSSYLEASKILFFATIPLAILHGTLNSADNWFENQYEKYLVQSKKDEIKRAKLNYFKQFDDIKKYSICLSLDYEGKTLNFKAKSELNKRIFSKISTFIKENIIHGQKHLPLELSYNNTLIITSNNFIEYDYVYSYLLKVLSVIKTKVENKYGFKLIPSVTTDAYATTTSKSLIEERHQQIKKMNFKNRACATETFSKKYRFMNQSKFAGIPVGLYEGNSQDSFDLNIVFKNLAQTLRA